MVGFDYENNIQLFSPLRMTGRGEGLVKNVIFFSKFSTAKRLLHLDAEVVDWFSSAYEGTPESQTAAKKHT